MQNPFFFIDEEMNHKASFATVYVHCNKECNEVKENEGILSVGGALRAVSLLSSFCNNEQNRCIKCFHPPVLMLIVDLRMNKIRISKTLCSVFLFSLSSVRYSSCGCC